MKRTESPCAHCTRVQNPAVCENKLCKDWKRWFLHRWAEIYRFGQKYGKKG